MNDSDRPSKRKPIIGWPAVIAAGLIIWWFYQNNAGTDLAALEAEVRKMVQQGFREAEAKNNLKYPVSVKNVTLAHETGSKYSGVVTVLRRGSEHAIGIEVTADGRSIIYRLDPASLLALGLQD